MVRLAVQEKVSTIIIDVMVLTNSTKTTQILREDGIRGLVRLHAELAQVVTVR